MRPQVAIVDGSNKEERFFIKVMKDKAATLGITLIELPENDPQSVTWMTKLDSSALSGTISS
jgi:hypothetical protein